MAIPWACRLTVQEHARAGRTVEVPRPACPSVVPTRGRLDHVGVIGMGGVVPGRRSFPL